MAFVDYDDYPTGELAVDVPTSPHTDRSRERTDPDYLTPHTFLAHHLDWNYIQEERKGGLPGVGPYLHEGYDLPGYESAPQLFLASSERELYVLIIYALYDANPVQYIEVVCGW